MGRRCFAENEKNPYSLVWFIDKKTWKSYNYLDCIDFRPVPVKTDGESRYIGGNNVEKYGVNELRKMFLEFFESKGHLAMKSFSLVPHNDNSLLLINSGMAPLKPYFTGQEIPPRRRGTT